MKNQKKTLPLDDIINILDPTKFKCEMCSSYNDKRDKVQFLNSRDWISSKKRDVVICRRCYQKGSNILDMTYSADVLIIGESIVKNRYGRTGRLGTGINISN